MAKQPDSPDADETPRVADILAGDRRALARAITLIESTRPDHRAAAETLLEELLPHAGGAVRIGISGAPGVGKSTFIEAFGLHLIEAGHTIAVLAVDPSSALSGGSILGDKTRMELLAKRPESFIRPSPAGQAAGGVARRTREAMLACEAAGFDIVLVETVGVGQSEAAVADMVDLFLLLIQPGGGDDLQGIKRGIMELAELVVVTKADGVLEAPARHTKADYEAALSLLRATSPHWKPRVLACSALNGDGIAEVWEAIVAHKAALTDVLADKRGAQARAWMWHELQDELMASLRADGRVAKQAAKLEEAVSDGKISPSAAAQKLLGVFLARD